MTKKLALVTGSQQGIGFGLVKALCKSFDGDVILTGLTEQDATNACAELEKQGLKPVPHQLDVRDQESVDRLRDFIKEKYGGLDILINNAGISFLAEMMRARGAEVPAHLAATSRAEIAAETMKVNFFGTLRVTTAMTPLLRAHARVVQTTSFGATQLVKRMKGDKADALLRTDWTTPSLCHFVDQYIKDVASGEHTSLGWPEDSSYLLASWAVWNLARVQQKTFDEDNNDVIVNAACPGITATEITNFKGKTIEEGCESALYLASLPHEASSPRGEMVHGKFVCGFNSAPPGLVTSEELFKN
ncbi:hypothetical protein CAPTEDRAFT_166205 [Capitella teleta]|uniref:Carbonyl reductase [NADPH] 1 n=1 Tax=Capitella teleta TaxID=283909 RepID=R7UG76_CAPTE|nr:hypothetical protein CAPTEDRAFT_166205 [Capitella teleta]|eukprot:ELU05068.1 hypothetical protein CAPTEDRAFT_166205 [Capitella teleta]